MNDAGQSAALQFDLVSQAFKENPFPTLTRMRERGPVVRVGLPLFGKVWMATTYEESMTCWLPGALRPPATNMLLRDPPDHRRLRGLVEQAFARHSVEALRPRLETLADEALDRLAEQVVRSTDGTDLLAHFARPFPLAVICEVLGLPPEHRPDFTRWATRFATSSGVLGIASGLLTGVRPMMRYVREEFRRQTSQPRGGLMAALIEAEEAGERLTEDELVAMVFLLLAAGHETTLHQIACSVLTLLDHPQQLGELRADWRLADSASQELLRYVSFAQVSKPRYARADTEFHGQPIRRGQMLFACLAAANSDPTVFQNPDRLDIHRHPNRHVAFGAGIHFCLGARLASVEMATALERLFTRFPYLHLAIPRSRVRFLPRFGTRALVALPVKW